LEGSKSEEGSKSDIVALVVADLKSRPWAGWNPSHVLGQQYMKPWEVPVAFLLWVLHSRVVDVTTQ
jgi:hypothetical protein